MAMERLRKQFAQDPSFLNEGSMGLVTSEANPNGRSGHIPGYPVGTIFPSRAACSKARVHGKTVAGIHGSKNNAAYSICMSGGYEDDEDRGNVIIYTGTGGQVDPYGSSTAQYQDQSFAHPDNASLALNQETGKPVRVIRGPNKKSPYAPSQGYRYDGLYAVEGVRLSKGKSGHAICQFKLRRLEGQPPLPIRS